MKQIQLLDYFRGGVLYSVCRGFGSEFHTQLQWRLLVASREGAAIFASALVMVGTLSGCSIGGGDETTVQTKSTTTGQELIDRYDKADHLRARLQSTKGKVAQG